MNDNPNNNYKDGHNDKNDELMDDLKKSLSRQVNETIHEEGTKQDKKDVGMGYGSGKAGNVPGNRQERKPSHKLLKFVVIPMGILVILAAVLLGTDFGKSMLIKLIGNYSYKKLQYEEVREEDIAGEEEKEPQTPGGEKKPQQEVSNILLVGVETFEGALNTDTMIVASLDSKNNVIKLTSLMRDLYVEIPGHRNNKLNSAYANGGISLLYDTIETNFGLAMDGYVLVDFNDFEEIVDYLGGVDIELTATEAKYLRTTNYISNPEYRNVVEGTQHMNGNQVLGYCRIRKVPTATENSDFGRTQRQRIVLEKIFEKLRSKNVIQLGIVMNTILSNIDIKTDITQTDYNRYLQQGVYLEKNALKTLRVPKDGTYNSEKVVIGKYNQDVLVPKSWQDTKAMLREFIYGDEE